MIFRRLILSCMFPVLCSGFVQPQSILRFSPSKIGAEQGDSSSGTGFGKVERPKKKKKKSNAPADAGSPVFSSEGTPSPDSQEPFLRSVEQGGSENVPEMDPNLSPEERGKILLKEKFGLKTYEEQRLSEKQQELRKERQKQLADWKKQAELNEDLDIMAMIPGGVQIAIDRFLKTGLAICTLLFVSAGGGITLEAWSKTSGTPLPDDIDNYIVNVIEPNFTTGLLVLLGFSVSLGAFAALQLSSGGAQYKEGQ